MMRFPKTSVTSCMNSVDLHVLWMTVRPVFVSVLIWIFESMNPGDKMSLGGEGNIFLLSGAL